jgi:peptide/nickel transport system permease protein
MSNRWGIIKFVLGRIAFGVLTLFIVSVIVFGATQLLPSDAAQTQLGRNATPASLKALRSELGLDRSKLNQYGGWLKGIVTGDAGNSLTGSKEAVTKLFADRIVNSLFLLVLASLVAIPISLWLGAYMARRRAPVVSNTMLALASLPEYTVGIVLVIVFASPNVFKWLPAVSAIDLHKGPWTDWKGAILPTITLALGSIPYISRTARASLVEVLQSDYVEMARLKGISERKVMSRHAFPNALGPVFQVIALNIAYFAAGIIVVEYVFNYRGIGGAMREAVNSRNIPVIQFLAMFLATIYIVTNIAADVATILVTPRLRTRLR